MGKKMVRKEPLNGDGTVVGTAAINGIGCRDAERLLVGVCGGAASVLTQNKVKMHLQVCSSCRGLYQPELQEESPSWLKDMIGKPQTRRRVQESAEELQA